MPKKHQLEMALSKLSKYPKDAKDSEESEHMQFLGVLSRQVHSVGEGGRAAEAGIEWRKKLSYSMKDGFQRYLRIAKHLAGQELAHAQRMDMKGQLWRISKSRCTYLTVI